MILWTFQAAATILIGFTVCALLHRRSSATLNLVLRATLLTVWLLPLSAILATNWHIETLLSGPAQSLSQVVKAPVETLPISPSTTINPAAAGSARDLTVLLPGLYLMVAAAIASRRLVGLHHIRRMVMQGDSVEGLVYVPGLVVPATFGTFSPAILMPREASEWPESRKRAAILHERAHIRRGDWTWQAFSALLTALHWANPAVWLLNRALRATAEAAADDEVLAEMRPSDYARELIAVASRAPRPPAALAMAGKGEIHGRILAVLNAARDRRAPARSTAGLLVGVMLASGIGIAALSGAQSPTDPLGEPKITFAEIRDVTGQEPLVTKYGPPFAADRRWLQLTVRVAGCSAEEPCSVKTVDPAMSELRFTEPKNVGRETQEFRFFWLEKKSVKRESVQVAVAGGTWQLFSDAVAYRVGSCPVKNKLVPSVAFAIPRSLGGKNVRVNAVDSKGGVLATTSMDFPPPVKNVPYRVSTVFVFPSLRVGSFKRVTFEVRNFKTQAFDDLPILPAR